MTNPELIQRIDAKDHDPERKGVDAHFSFDYMGSAEFEWGALGNALKVTRQHIKKLEIQRISPMTGGVLWYVGLPSKFKDVVTWVNKHLQNFPEATMTKERTYMRKSMGLDNESWKSSPIGWWAICQDPAWALFMTSEYAKTWLEALKKK